jgi:phosphoribosyl 1,2-cyclic phosphodiesterase/CheY-like chemotaxis protein
MKTVLLIDDDRASRLVIAQWLKSAGWRVLEADNGEEGLQRLDTDPPDVILTDLLMPRCNGFQVCRTVRERPDKLRDTRIVVFTSSTYPTDRINAFECGADEFLVKPIKQAGLVDLLARLTTPGTEILRRKPVPEPAPQRQGEPEPILQPAAARRQPTCVRFWGVRGSIPTPGPDTAHYGGNTSCVEVRADGEIIILDAGTGIRPLGLSLVNEFKRQPVGITILLTHTHWDHIQGFPFFVPAYNSRNSIRILGYEGVREGLGKTLSSQMESPYFPIALQSMPGYIKVEQLKDMEFQIGSVRVQAKFVNHPGICVGYRLFTSAGSVVFIPDNETHLRLKSTPSPHTVGATDAEAIDYARKQDEELIEFVRDADVLILDSQYDAEEYPGHVGWGHTCVDDSTMVALQANVKNLYLFHHDPGHDDAHVAKMEKHAKRIASRKGSPLNVEAAREGVERVLPVKQ